jgi:hypothetical protein
MDGFGPRTEDLYRVRTLPNEDICLWVAPIDNSRVVRESNPEVWNECWRYITAACLAVILTVGLLLPGAYGLLAGYRINKLERENAALTEQSRLLEIEESRLLTPERLEEVAAMQSFQDPTPEQVHYLEPGGDESLALGRAK